MALSSSIIWWERTEVYRAHYLKNRLFLALGYPEIYGERHRLIFGDVNSANLFYKHYIVAPGSTASWIATNIFPKLFKFEWLLCKNLYHIDFNMKLLGSVLSAVY